MAHENDGHRMRLRQRFIKEGASSFQDHEVLELLLFGSVARKDTNKLAHNLLSKFGGFSGVLNASPEQLMTVKGVSVVTACNLAIIKEVFHRYRRDEQEKSKLKGVASIIKYVQSAISESIYERMVVVYVDGDTTFLQEEEFTSDSTQEVNIDVKKIVSTAMRLNAAGVLLFHCHSNGPCQPSSDDIHFTEKLYFALATMNIALLEHMIFNKRQEYYSFYKSGDMDMISDKYNNTLKQ
ncbi:MAG: DNA repair protein RadC [Clostridiales bacterium]|nr:DNA repair protein RadC [Clostridiales bacterium]